MEANMDIIIACLLVIVAAAMFLGKPLKIEIHHKYDPAEEISGPDQEQLDRELKKDQQTMNDIIANFNKTIMGVESDESNE